jgi:hypothetical protein
MNVVLPNPDSPATYVPLAMAERFLRPFRGRYLLVYASPCLAHIFCLLGGYSPFFFFFSEWHDVGGNCTVGLAAECGRVSRHTSMPSRMLLVLLLTFAMPIGATASDAGAISFVWQRNQAGKTRVDSDGSGKYLFRCCLGAVEVLSLAMAVQMKSGVLDGLRGELPLVHFSAKFSDSF